MFFVVINHITIAIREGKSLVGGDLQKSAWHHLHIGRKKLQNRVSGGRSPTLRPSLCLLLPTCISGMVSVFLDQAGVAVGREMDRISRTPGLGLSASSPSSSSSAASSSLFYADNKDCPAYTWAASHHRQHEVESLVDDVFGTLERLDSSPSFVTLVADASQGLGSGLHSALLEQLRDALPLQLRSVLLLPPGSLSGVQVYNACLSSFMSLALADCTMIRGTDDALHLASSLCPATDGLSLRDAHSALACDLLFACRLYDVSGPSVVFPSSSSSSSSSAGRGLHTSSRYGGGSEADTSGGVSIFEAWPCVGPLVDVRSSLYRLYRESSRRTKAAGTSSSGSGSSHSPLRAMATNLHALHLYHVNGSGTEALGALAVERAYLRTVHFGGGGGMVARGCEYSSADVRTALDWACPKVQWPALGLRAEHASPGAGPRAAAVAYACPYAARTLRQTAHRASLLLRRGAFLQRFAEFGLDREEIVHSVEGILQQV